MPAPLPRLVLVRTFGSTESSHAKMSPSAHELPVVQWICASKLTSNDVSGSGDLSQTPE